MFSNGDYVYVATSRNPWEKNNIGKKGVVVNFIGRNEQLQVQLDNNDGYSYFYQDELALQIRKGDRVLINDEKDVPHKGQEGTVDIVFDTNLSDPNEWYYYVKFPTEERRGVLYHLNEISIVSQTYTQIRIFLDIPTAITQHAWDIVVRREKHNRNAFEFAIVLGVVE